ncbi:MAG: alpha-amylase family glycosyl hydrolase [Thomasclavelia sp.]|nr:alpha-amylase family glycosyl hydrolase [Thomasclavelia sp.]
MWFNESVFYQVCTLDFCGAPKSNDGICTNRIKRLTEFTDYYKDLGIGALYLNPIFESDSHGYDTKDYRLIDKRLGTNDDFKQVVRDIHSKGIKVVLDGVFNHVGRGFFALEDVRINRENSKYKDWFLIDFNRNSNYNDGFFYEGWEGHYELVKLNLDNKEVQDYLLESIGMWIDEFDIDGLRLDVAYCLPTWFLAMIKDYTSKKKKDFFVLGEVLHDNADYMMSEGKLDSITDYPSYKGMWSSFNSLNMFEIAHTFNRNMNELYHDRNLLLFVDNHDVERIATKLTNPKHLPLIYGFMLACKGIPCIYYGSEWGQEGAKVEGSDDSLRPEYTKPLPNELTKYIKKLIACRNESKALQMGEFKQLHLNNKQYIFERVIDSERVIVALNIDENECHIDFNANAGEGIDLITGKKHDFGGGTDLAPYSIYYWKV